MEATSAGAIALMTKLCGIVVPENNIDALAGQFVGNCPAHAIHACPRRHQLDRYADHSNEPRFLPCDRESLAPPMMEIRSWPISGTSSSKQCDQKLLDGAAGKQLGAPNFRPDLVKVCSQAISRPNSFSHNHVSLRNESLCVRTEVKVNIATFNSLDDSVDEFTCTVLVGFDDLGAFRFRTRCTITCLAVCAAIRPNSTLSTGSSIKSPDGQFRILFLSGAQRNLDFFEFDFGVLPRQLPNGGRFRTHRFHGR